MSRAESLLNELMNAWLHGAEEDVPKVVSEIEEYLNRKEDLVVGSEWVCDTDCYGLMDGMSPTIFNKGINVEITDLFEITYVYIKAKERGIEFSLRFPYEQFLACFSPKENES